MSLFSTVPQKAGCDIVDSVCVRVRPVRAALYSYCSRIMYSCCRLPLSHWSRMHFVQPKWFVNMYNLQVGLVALAIIIITKISSTFKLNVNIHNIWYAAFEWILLSSCIYVEVDGYVTYSCAGSFEWNSTTFSNSNRNSTRHAYTNEKTSTQKWSLWKKWLVSRRNLFNMIIFINHLQLKPCEFSANWLALNRWCDQRSDQLHMRLYIEMKLFSPLCFS